MVFEISRAIINRGLEVNSGLDVNVFGLHLQCAAMNINDAFNKKERNQD